MYLLDKEGKGFDIDCGVWKSGACLPVLPTLIFSATKRRIPTTSIVEGSQSVQLSISPKNKTTETLYEKPRWNAPVVSSLFCVYRWRFEQKCIDVF